MSTEKERREWAFIKGIILGYSAGAVVALGNLDGVIAGGGTYAGFWLVVFVYRGVRATWRDRKAA